MNRLKLMFFILFISNLCFGQSSISVEISEKVTIKFPSIPETKDDGLRKVYQVFHQEYVLNVVKIDLTDNKDFKIKPEDLDRFYTGMIKGGLDATKDPKLITQKKIIIGGYEGREIEATMDYDGLDDIKTTKQILLKEKIVFMFEIWNLTGKNQEKITETFFNSISIN